MKIEERKKLKRANAVNPTRDKAEGMHSYYCPEAHLETKVMIFLLFNGLVLPCLGFVFRSCVSLNFACLADVFFFHSPTTRSLQIYEFRDEIIDLTTPYLSRT